MTAEELAQILDELGRRLGPAGEYVFRLAVERVVIESALWVAAGGLILLVGLIVTSRALRGRNGYGDVREMLVMLGSAAVFVGAFLCLSAAVPLLTPEYEALTRLLRAVKP